MRSVALTLSLLAAAPAIAAPPTGVERLLALSEPALVGVVVTLEVEVVWVEPGGEPRRYGPWAIVRQGEGAIVSSAGMVATASPLVRLGDPQLLQPLIDERFLLEVAEAWRREAEAKGQTVVDDSLREGLRRLRRRGRVELPPGSSPVVRVVVEWGERQLPARVVQAGSAEDPLALLAIEGAGPWPRLPHESTALGAGARVLLLSRREGAPPAVSSGVVSRHPGVTTAWATDLAIEPAQLGAPVVVGDDGRWAGVALDRLESESAYGVSWIAPPRATIEGGSSEIDELWRVALEALWGGDPNDARATLEEILAIQEGHAAARRELDTLGPASRRGGSSRWLLAGLAGLLVLLGTTLVWWARSLRRRARREMIAPSADSKETWR